MANRRKSSFLLATIVIFCLVPRAIATGQPAPTAGFGRSSTMLPDGRVLLAGGFDSHAAPSRDASISTADGTAVQLKAGLNIPRAGHTATMLPDGTVFIFGGVGTDGRVVTTAELFDPATEQFSALLDVVAVPRAFHTATLLTDGTVLLAGGVLAGGEFPDDVQLWDYRTHRALSSHALLSTPREGHTAALRADGAVELSGGTNHFGRPVSINEIYDPITRRFHFATPDQTADSALAVRLSASIPSDGATNVALHDPIALRFSQLLDVTSARPDTFVLTGPNEAQAAIPAKVTAAENGRLVFVVPSAPLLPGTHYVLRIVGTPGAVGARGAKDTKGEVLPETFIAFDTAGEPPDSNGPDWTPNSNWTDPGGITRFKELPPLHAPAGVTALAGQVLKVNGWPLEHVTLEIEGGARTRTDSTGRFLLRDLAPGHHVLWIDGSTGNHGDSVYGLYEVGVTILPNKTNVLNYTIWMTRLDMAHAVNIPSPTTSELVITNPAMPGLELRLPADTTITDRFGKVARQVSITPIPLNKTPFPLPAGVQVPIYFTVQPGGAYLKVGGNKDGLKGARLFYPNGFNLRPGTPFDFWNYDAEAKGWFIYGQGKVSPDGGQIIPNPRVLLYEFTGAMVGGASGAPATGTPVGPQPKSGDPVVLSTGQFVYTKTDLTLPDTIPINFTRTYMTNDTRSRSFGIGATNSYDFFMVGNTVPYTYQELIQPDGGRVRFDRVSPGTNYIDAVYIATSAPGVFYGAVLSWNSDPSLPGTWKLVMKNGTVMSFPESPGSTNPLCQAVIQIKDRYGNLTKIDRAAGTCMLTKITSPNGRYINVTSDAQSRITQLTDNAGRTVSYTYNAAGQLATVTDVAGGVTAFTYDDWNRMLTITDPRGVAYLTNQYDVFGRVTQQTEADGGVYQFRWTSTLTNQQLHYFYQGQSADIRYTGCWGTNGMNRYEGQCQEGYMALMAQVDVTDPRGYVREVKFNSSGYMSSDTHALGQPEEQTVTYQYYADNLLESVTDAMGRVTSFDYDSQGNTTRVTRLAGTPNAVTSLFKYSGAFGQLDSMADPFFHPTFFSYDASGNRIGVRDALGHQTTFTYNAAGQVASITDSVNNTVQFGYFGGDQVSSIDPMGNVRAQFRDSVGRTVSQTDPLGQTTRFQYNVSNGIQQVTDSRGQVSTFTYDANGNPLSITDAAGHITSYTYDSMDRRATRTDALNRAESYTYDLNGNISSVTDRKGQVTSFTYDGLNRLTNVCFKQVVNAGVTSCESTTSYQYDTANRRVIITDSLGGTITTTYDDFGRLTGETACSTGAPACGQVSYSYDANGRLTSKTLGNQATFNYSYDAVGHLVSVTQGTKSVQLTYDAGGRLHTRTLPSGLVATYNYDGASHLVEIHYSGIQGFIGNITYSYDTLNRRVGVGGTLARIVLPQPTLRPATYDAANQIASWNGTPVSYDANGSLINDGQSAYTWNARGQLTAISGAVNASFSYDALGRRTAKTIGPNTQNFVYDGGGIAQEMTGSTITASLWSGGGSGFVERTDSSGTVDPLTDALGNVIGLADANGNLVTQYAYDPFGGTIATGAASANPFQYIGRENDQTGLYYLHARYYSPALMRFISEDPLGFAGGDVNLHAYTANAPTNFRDPSGTSFGLQDCLIGAGINTALELGTDYLTHRKSSLSDAFSMATLGYAAEGCESGIVGAIFGELVIAPLLDFMAPYVARLFTKELVDAAEAALADACGLCFPAGTQVRTTHGLVPIEKIKVGDHVLSRNMATGKLEYKKVTKLIAPHQDKLLQLKIAGESKALRSTPEHPFFVKHAGQAQGDWVKASEIKMGDSILTRQGTWARVTATSPVEKEETVYNFEVEEDHDYFVGASGLLVHNGGPCKIGTDVHQGFLDFLTDLTDTKPTDWRMATNPGQTGIDATYLGEKDIGFRFAELKPNSQWGLDSFGDQLERWNLPNSTVALFRYNTRTLVIDPSYFLF